MGHLEQLQAASSFAGFHAALHIELAVDTLRLRFHSIDRDDQFLGDLRVRAARSEQAEDALLLRA